MFERFTERARHVVVLAQDEVRALNHHHIGTEHILLGLLREEEGLAARVLESLDVTLEEVRAHVVRTGGEGTEATTGQIPFTPRAKRTLELSLREALSMRHNYIGTEHILLGLVREDDAVAAGILRELGAPPERIRDEILRMLAGPGRREQRSDVSATPPASPAELEAAAGNPELALRLAGVRREKEAAIEAQEFERATELRERERDLQRELLAARSVGPPAAEQVIEYDLTFTGARAPLVAGVVVAALGIPAGLLVGWLIWA